MRILLGKTYLKPNVMKQKVTLIILLMLFNFMMLGYAENKSDDNITAELLEPTSISGCNLFVTLSATVDVSCSGGNTGYATVVANGGNPPLSYVWSPFGGNTASASGLSAGIYIVTATDVDGCTSSCSVTISEPPPLTGAGSSTPVSVIGGSDGSASVSVSGGTPGYSYLWSPSGATTSTISGLTAGNYSVTITDASGCTVSLSISVSQPGTPVLSCMGAFLPLNLFDGLVGWWPFCGDAEDESGNGNNGTVNGATLTIDRFGNANSAYEFDGVDDFIEVNDTTSLNLQNYSVSVWANPSVISAIPMEIVAKGQYPYNYGININDSNQNISGFYNENNNYAQITTSATNYINSWKNIVLTYNGVSCSLYVDGMLSGTTLASNIIPQVGDLLFGKVPTGYNFNGIVDDIGIWNRALDSSEVVQLYNTGLCNQPIAGSCDTLVFNANITGFNPITYANQVKVYPNPASDNLVIDCGTNYTGLNGYSIRITNLVGQVVYDSPVASQITNIQLNPPAWVNGTYLVQFIHPNGTIQDTKRIIIQ